MCVVQHPRLATQRLDYVGMAVAHVGYVVERVEIAPTLSIEEPNTFPPYEMERLVVKDRKRSAKPATSAFYPRVYVRC